MSWWAAGASSYTRRKSRATLFHRTPADINYFGECEKPLDPDTAAFLRDVAWKTVAEFNGWN